MFADMPLTLRSKDNVKNLTREIFNELKGSYSDYTSKYISFSHIRQRKKEIISYSLGIKMSYFCTA